MTEDKAGYNRIQEKVKDMCQMYAIIVHMAVIFIICFIYVVWSNEGKLNGLQNFYIKSHMI